MERSIRALVLLLVLLLCFADISASSQHHPIQRRKPRHRHSGFSPAECPDACSYRCSKTHHRKPCMFFCQKCCFKCRCVPPGTYGRKETCPCYNNWKTQTGGPKCP